MADKRPCHPVETGLKLVSTSLENTIKKRDQGPALHKTASFKSALMTDHALPGIPSRSEIP